ncbi:gp31 [Rhodococcus phage ReqiPine5]|uniref:Gp31 n=1 Tax=Rhodococcus phage ReqiPine5 TaxID=691963 RepID=D4P806_9CAUD|nr:gp31 [Rhodococcus phage ReqiPine5]ADD81136.1 gp31 [Rhodococcus phage ReqiPine5]
MDRQVCLSPYLLGSSGLPGRLGMSVTLPTLIPAVGDITPVPVGASLTGPATELPGVTLSNTAGYFTNTGPLPIYVQAMIIRWGWSLVASNPNVTQIRDRFVHVIDGEFPDADTTDSYTSQFTAGVDLATNKSAVPLAGVLTRRSGPSIHEETIGPVPAGSTVSWAYRITAWTPPPFSTNGNNNNVQTSASIRGGRILFLQLPEPDRG